VSAVAATLGIWPLDQSGVCGEHNGPVRIGSRWLAATSVPLKPAAILMSRSQEHFLAPRHHEEVVVAVACGEAIGWHQSPDCLVPVDQPGRVGGSDTRGVATGRIALAELGSAPCFGAHGQRCSWLPRSPKA
jgi:hypothetical protein